jgi:hypothetical protein
MFSKFLLVINKEKMLPGHMCYYLHTKLTFLHYICLSSLVCVSCKNNNMDVCIVSGRRRRRNSSNQDEIALANYDGPLYHARELTKDHHPDREVERSRVEASGGYVLEWAGVYRVNGELALSRAIGDVPYKRLVI